MKKILNRKKKAAISAAIAIPIAVFLIIAAIPATTTYKSAQIGNPTLEFQVETAEKILEGRVVSVEVKQIDQFVEIPDDPEASFWRQELYQFVTVEATKYLKDETGENPKQVTFYDDVTGCFDLLEKQCQVAETAIAYGTGEKALFILERIDDPANGPLDGLLTTLGYLETYKIADDKAQSEYGKSEGKMPKNLTDLEKEIKEIMMQRPNKKNSMTQCGSVAKPALATDSFYQNYIMNVFKSLSQNTGLSNNSDYSSVINYSCLLYL